MTTYVVKWDVLRQEVEQAHSIDDLRDIRDRAEALRQYAKRRDESLDMQNKFAEITLRCNRRLGEMIPEQITHGTKFHDVTLSDLGINRHDSMRWQTIATLPEETFEQHIEQVKARHEELTMAGLLRVATRGVPAALQSSETNEWYTPAEYINTARELMGGIDLDPASCEFANQVVQATRYYDKDGLNQPWHGRIWLNPPYGVDAGVSNQELWSHTLIERFTINRTVTEAVLLVNANTEAKWFQPLYDYLICLTDHRIRFYNLDGESSQPTQGNALVYFGTQCKRFIELFSRFGTVVERAS